MSKSSGHFGLENQNESIHHILDYIARTKRDTYSSTKRNTVADQVQFRSTNIPKVNKKPCVMYQKKKTVRRWQHIALHCTCKKEWHRVIFLSLFSSNKDPSMKLGCMLRWFHFHGNSDEELKHKPSDKSYFTPPTDCKKEKRREIKSTLFFYSIERTSKSYEKFDFFTIFSGIPISNQTRVLNK